MNTLFENLRKEAAQFEIILNDEAICYFSLYLEELKRWNKKVNLFRRRNDQEIMVKDFLDSLTICKYLFPGASILDVGSGGGFPGIPIKISRPDLRVVLLEIRSTKIFFLRNIIRLLGLKDMEVSASRNEIFEKFDFIVARAFGSITKLMKTGSPYLKENGIIISMKAKKGREELDQQCPVLKQMGWIPCFMDHIKLPVFGHERILIGFRRDVSRETNSEMTSGKIFISKKSP